MRLAFILHCHHLSVSLVINDQVFCATLPLAHAVLETVTDGITFFPFVVASEVLFSVRFFFPFVVQGTVSQHFLTSTSVVIPLRPIWPTLVMSYSATGTFITAENLGRLTLPSANHLEFVTSRMVLSSPRRTALLRGVTTEISMSVSATSRVRTACSTSSYLGRDKSVLLTTSAIPGR